MKKGKRNKESKIKIIIHDLLKSNFFKGGKTTLDVIQKLTQRGFTVKGKKIGMVARMLTQMCQDSSTGLEREAIPIDKRVKGEKWLFKKIKKR